MTDPNAQAPVPGSAEHDAAMAAKFDQSQGGTPDGGTPADQGGTEELILGKFKSHDDLIKAYTELESKVGQPKADEPAPADDGGAAKAVENAGLDMGALSAEFAENGELSAESYEKLEKAGITKDIVDLYIEGQKAVVERIQLTAYSVVGGEEAYGSMIQWATANMTDAEIDTFNKAVNSTNPDVVKLAVTGLKGRYEASNGSEPDLAGGGFGAADGPSFESWAQVTEAMRDPRYAKDPAYRRGVEQKLARSNPI